MIEWGRQRSASEQVDRINANGAAIMLGNAWGDTIFPPNQYAKFYERLTGPKRLEFRPGDHATAEGTGLLGLPNDTWTNAHRWFDRYLKGERNGVDTEAPVQIKSRSDDGYEGYADWKSVGAGAPRSSRSPTASTSSPMSTPAPTAASSSCPAPSTSSSRRRRSPPSRSSPGLRGRLAVGALRPGAPDPRHREAAHHRHPHQGRRHLRRVPLRRRPARHRQARQQRPVHLPRQGPRPGLRRGPGAVLHRLRRPRGPPARPRRRHRRPALHRAQPDRRAADLLLAAHRSQLRVGALREQ